MRMMEERELKSWIIDNAKYRANLNESNKLIAAFGKAVREDCAKVVFPGGECGEESEYGKGWDAACRDRASAIRGKK
jgi:hypothetical protein